MAQRICDVRARWPPGAERWVGPFLCRPGDTAESVRKSFGPWYGWEVVDVVFSELKEGEGL